MFGFLFNVLAATAVLAAAAYFVAPSLLPFLMHMPQKTLLAILLFILLILIDLGMKKNSKKKKKDD